MGVEFHEHGVGSLRNMHKINLSYSSEQEEQEAKGSLRKVESPAPICKLRRLIPSLSTLGA